MKAPKAAESPQAKEPAPKSSKEVEMEEKLAKMLKEKKGQFQDSDDIVPFTKILMKMTKMAQVLKHIHMVFKQVDLDGNGTLELDELQTLMTKIGCDLPPDGLNLMFECADLEHENKLTEREFVVSLAIAYLMKAIPAFEKKQSSAEAPAAEGAPEDGDNPKRLGKRSSVAHISVEQPDLTASASDE